MRKTKNKKNFGKGREDTSMRCTLYTVCSRGEYKEIKGRAIQWNNCEEKRKRVFQ